MGRPALFLDRDGVINEDLPYVHRVEDFRFMDGIFSLVQTAQRAGYLIVVVTNQAGIGRGLYTEDDFWTLTAWMVDQFARQGCHIDGVYFCPTHPEHGLGRYRVDSVFRKPGPGMLFQASAELNIDLARSILVGDKESDIQAGLAAGVGVNCFLATGPTAAIPGCITVDTIRSVIGHLQPLPEHPMPAQQSSTDYPPIAIIMAAGRGTRMGGDLPKVLFKAAGKPLVRWVLDALAAAGIVDRIVVVGYRAALVEEALAGLQGVSFAVQKEQRGTGDAVASAAALIEQRLGQAPSDAHRPVVIVCGDSPMLRPESVAGLLRRFDALRAACLLGTAVTTEPAGLGRIVRDANGAFVGIVEEKDATAEQRGIHEVNMSTYVFEARALLHALSQLNNANASGEYYITDCPGILLAEGRVVDAVACLDQSETLSVNTPEQLAAVAAALASRPT